MRNIIMNVVNWTKKRELESWFIKKSVGIQTWCECNKAKKVEVFPIIVCECVFSNTFITNSLLGFRCQVQESIRGSGMLGVFHHRRCSDQRNVYKVWGKHNYKIIMAFEEYFSAVFANGFDFTCWREICIRAEITALLYVTTNTWGKFICTLCSLHFHIKLSIFECQIVSKDKFTVFLIKHNEKTRWVTFDPDFLSLSH